MSLYTPLRHIRSGGIAPLIFKLGTIWNSVARLPQKIYPLQSLKRRLGRTQVMSGVFGDEKNLLPMLEINHYSPDVI
jgi:hypothetical protein